MFLKNAKILRTFRRSHDAAGIQAGFSILLTDPRDRATILQVMRSFLQLDEYSIDRSAIINLMLSLTHLDQGQQNDIFGPRASINNPLTSETASNSVVGSEVALQGIYDDGELESLSREQLMQRIRQMAFTIHTLEFRGIQTEFVKHQQNNVYTPDKDPKGYYKTMMMSHDTADDVFEAILKKHYYVLAAQCHPDKGVMKDAAEFNKLREAYDFLLDPHNRKTYGERSGERMRM